MPRAATKKPLHWIKRGLPIPLFAFQHKRKMALKRRRRKLWRELAELNRKIKEG